MDAVQSELIRDLVKRVSGASLSLWMPFTSTCFKTESATSTVHSYRLVTPRTTESTRFIDLPGLSGRR
ncbi:hypothetical protein C8R46DRAFT_1235799 [Mycena filopes]|nr:hypothetical protein C8R46DRAFT_1235799 [Mycena filopes]